MCAVAPAKRPILSFNSKRITILFAYLFHTRWQLTKCVDIRPFVTLSASLPRIRFQSSRGKIPATLKELREKSVATGAQRIQTIFVTTPS